MILLAAFALRMHGLTDVPPGLTHDEAAHGHDAASVLAGFRPVYFTVGYGREPLYDYANAGWFAALGRSIFTLRLASVFWSMPMIALTYGWARRSFGARTALFAAALLAVSFWPLATARQALRSTALPALFLVAIVAFERLTRYSTRIARNGEWREFWIQDTGLWILDVGFWILIFGLALAAALYTYLAARGLWLLFPAALIHLAIFAPNRFRRAALPVVAGLLLAGVLAVPLFSYLWAHPGAEGRLEMLEAPLQSLRQGNPRPVLANARETFFSYFLPGHGDSFLAYNLPGQPFFDPLTALLFLAGVLICLRRIKQPAPAFALLWLGVGVAPALLTGPTASFTRSIGAQPVTYVFVALAANELIRRWPLAKFAIFPMLAITPALTTAAYFKTWGKSPEVRAAYQHTLIEELAYVKGRSDLWPAGLSSVYPSAAHDPYVAEMVMPVTNLRFFDARSALLIAGERGFLLIPAATPLDPFLADFLGPARKRIILAPFDLDSYFQIYPAPDRLPLPPAGVEVQTDAGPLTTPVNIGGALEFWGWQVPGAHPGAPLPPPGGNTLTLATFWRVIDPQVVGPVTPPAFKTDASFFLHVLDPEGNIVAQQDTLDAPSWQWQRGDLIVQIHRAPLPPGSPAPLTLALGLYNRGDGPRLQILGPDGQAHGTRILLDLNET